MIKQVKEVELQHFVTFGPRYFSHLKGVYANLILHHGGTNTASTFGMRALPQSSLLVKVLGVFSVTLRRRSKKEARYYILMESLLYGCSGYIDRIYDLKGSQRNRMVQEDAFVLLDENLVQQIKQGHFFFCAEEDKSWIDDVLNSDATLLSNNKIMDYSMMVVVDVVRERYTIGILDYLHPYSLAKNIENKVKAGMEGLHSFINGGTERDPTVTEPAHYKIRFLKWMSNYFCGVPDKMSPLKRLQKQKIQIK